MCCWISQLFDWKLLYCIWDSSIIKILSIHPLLLLFFRNKGMLTSINSWSLEFDKSRGSFTCLKSYAIIKSISGELDLRISSVTTCLKPVSLNFALIFLVSLFRVKVHITQRYRSWLIEKNSLSISSRIFLENGIRWPVNALTTECCTTTCIFVTYFTFINIWAQICFRYSAHHGLSSNTWLNFSMCDVISCILT